MAAYEANQTTRNKKAWLMLGFFMPIVNKNSLLSVIGSLVFGQLKQFTGQAMNNFITTEVNVDVDIDLNDHKEEIRAWIIAGGLDGISGEDNLPVWEDLQQKVSLFGVDELKRYIEREFQTRFCMNIKL